MTSTSIYHEFHYVYRITNIKRKLSYIGVRSCKIDPKKDLGIKYFSSSLDKEFQQDQKSNPSNYKYQIIAIFDSREEASRLEIHLHMMYDVARNLYFYNKARATSTGFNTYGISHTLESRKRMSEAATGRTLSPEHSQKISKANTGKTRSPEMRMKISEANTGKTRSPESRKKQSEAITGKFTVKGLDDVCFRIGKDDPRFISREVRGQRSIIIQIQNIQSGEIINHWKSDPLPDGFNFICHN